MASRYFLPALVVMASILGSCAPPPPDSVVLVLVDTLRADHLGAYGYARDTSPAFDAFAAQGVLFRQARSQAPCTFPSVNSMLTSRPPLEFLGQSEGRIGVPEGYAYLPEILREKGLRTIGISASPVVRKTPTRWNPEGGFDRGFDVFDESCEADAAECVLEVARSHLAVMGDRSFFLYLHFYDPHEPYRPPRHHERQFAGRYRGPFGFVRGGNVYPVARQIERSGSTRLDERGLQHLIDLYDDEIRYWDGQFDRLLRSLEELGLDERTLVLVTSDHGESFLEHGKVAHCRTLFDPEIHIPLALSSPGLPEGLEIEAPVSALDLTPTVLDVLGLSRPEGKPMAGRSLRGLWEAREPGGSTSFALTGSRSSATDERFKLILDSAAEDLWLYDLREDPGESTDVSESHADRSEGLRREVLRWLREQEEAAGWEDGAAVAEQEQERLRTVGYLQ